MEGIQEVTNALSNGTIPDPLRPTLPQNWGFATPKFQSLLSQEREKLWTSNVADRIHSQGPPEQKHIKNFGEKGAWAYPGTVQFLSTPYYLRKGQGYEVQIWEAYSQRPCEQKPIKIGEKGEHGRRRIQGLLKFFHYPPLSQERVKLRTSNFSTHVLSIDRNKSPL